MATAKNIKWNSIQIKCETCKHYEKRMHDDPCRNCYKYKFWEAKEEKMDNNRIILSECEKMAKKYNLEMEGEWIPMDKLLNVSFKQVSGIWIAAEKTFEIHNVDQKDPAKVLETIERGLIKKFNIDLNKFEPVKVSSIKNVIFNDPATIIFWDDNTKTVVKAQDEDYDPEKGMAMAIAKKALGNQGNYCNVFKKWLPEEVEEKEMTITDAMAAISEFAKHFNLGEVDFRLSPKKEGDE